MDCNMVGFASPLVNSKFIAWRMSLYIFILFSFSFESYWLCSILINYIPRGSMPFILFVIDACMNKFIMQKIIPHLWFDSDEEDAVKFYTSVFRNSKITGITHYWQSSAEVSRRPKGTVMTLRFELEGQQFMTLNGGPVFRFSPAISFLVNCETQEEVDDLWEKLSEGWEKEQCGWLKDKFGISWQIVPNILGEMVQDKDAIKLESVIKAMLQMNKIDIQGLRKAYTEG